MVCCYRPLLSELTCCQRTPPIILGLTPTSAFLILNSLGRSVIPNLQFPFGARYQFARIREVSNSLREEIDLLVYAKFCCSNCQFGTLSIHGSLVWQKIYPGQTCRPTRCTLLSISAEPYEAGD